MAPSTWSPWASPMVFTASRTLLSSPLAITTELASPRSPTRLMNSTPSIPGMSMSQMMTSGWGEAARTSSAAVPSAAWDTRSHAEASEQTHGRPALEVVVLDHEHREVAERGRARDRRACGGRRRRNRRTGCRGGRRFPQGRFRLRRRLHAELLGQDGAAMLIGLDGAGPIAGLAQDSDPQLVAGLAERVGPDQSFGGRRRGRQVTGGAVAPSFDLEGSGVDRFELPADPVDPVAVMVRKEGKAGQGRRSGTVDGGFGAFSGLQQGAGPSELLPDFVEVDDHVSRKLEPVAPPGRQHLCVLQPGLVQVAADLGHDAPQGRRPRVRKGAWPESVGQFVLGDDSVVLAGQVGEHELGAATGEAAAGQCFRRGRRSAREARPCRSWSPAMARCRGRGPAPAQPRSLTPHPG